MALSIVFQARRLLAQRKCNEVIRLLEPHVLEYRDSFAFHFYIGLAYLYLGEMGNAKDYFSRARELKPNDIELMAATAAMALRRHDTGKAVEYYLRILNIKPSHELAKRGLASIRKCNTAEAMGDFIREGKIKKLYPMPSILEFYSSYIRLAVVASVLAVILAVGVGFAFSYFSKRPLRDDITSLNLSSKEMKQAIDMEGVFRNVLTHQEVVETFAKAQSEFQKYNDNLCQVEINKVLNSNATFSIKQKALGLQALLKEPRFDTIKNIFSYQEVAKEPYLYNACYVVWKGMPTNVKKGEESTSFDLLVGYDTKHRLEGTVPVFYNFASEVDVEKAISVLAQLQVEEGVRIALRGIAIHQSAKPIEE